MILKLGKMLIMNKVTSLILFIIISISFVKCKGVSTPLTNYETEKIIISNGNLKTEQQPLLAFESSDKNVVSLCFLDKFNDTILLYLNQKKITSFERNDSISYKKLSHNEIFKFIRREKK